MTDKQPAPSTTSDAGSDASPNATPNPTLNQATRTGVQTEDERLLNAPRPGPADFTHTDTWRVLRIQGEFVSGFDALAEVGAAVTFFGSARTSPEDPMYARAT